MDEHRARNNPGERVARWAGAAMGDELALAILAKLAAVEEKLDRMERAALAATPENRLILAISDHVRGDHGECLSFTGRELIRRGRFEPALRLAIAEVCGRVDARVLGHKLAKLSHAPVAGYLLKSRGKERDGNTWELERVRVLPLDLAEIVARRGA